MEISDEEIVLRSAELRGQRQLSAAIELIGNNIQKLGSGVRLNAWLEAFYAAKEMGDRVLAEKFAAEAAKEDPEVPSIQEYLK